MSYNEYEVSKEHGEFLTGRREGQQAYESLLETAEQAEGELIISLKDVKSLSPSFFDSSIGSLVLEVKEGELAYKDLQISIAHIENQSVESTVETVLHDIGYPDIPILA